MILAPVFVIYAFGLVKVDDFSIVGVYSTKADAEAAAEIIRPQLKHMATVCSCSMEDVMDALALARLSGLGLKLEITPAGSEPA